MSVLELGADAQVGRKVWQTKIRRCRGSELRSVPSSATLSAPQRHISQQQVRAQTAQVSGISKGSCRRRIMHRGGGATKDAGAGKVRCDLSLYPELSPGLVSGTVERAEPRHPGTGWPHHGGDTPHNSGPSGPDSRDGKDNLAFISGSLTSRRKSNNRPLLSHCPQGLPRPFSSPCRHPL